MRNVNITDEQMRKALYEGIVKFSFRKKDGSIRRATGTTNLNIVRSVNHGFDDIVGTGIRRKSVGCVAFFDLEAMEWRSYTEGSLIVTDIPEQ